MSVSTRGRGWGARSLGDCVLRELDPLVAKRGLGEAALLLRWREIVGARIAGFSQPARLQWPPRPRAKATENKGKRRETPREPATLVLRVEPGFGLEAQHLAPAIIERVNAHLGWRCVARLALRQEALNVASPPPRRPPRPD
ncbi:DciA family protein, partial [Methylocystis sp. 9N]